MDKGQHLRLVFPEVTGTPTEYFVALASDLTVHFSANTEDSTTKDTSDTTGTWNEYEVTQRSGDIQFGALVGVGTDATGKSFADWIDKVSDTEIDWKLVIVNGTNNRTIVKTVCSGKGKISNLQATAPNRQKATYSGTLNMFGPVTVGTD
jgi:TP901-1 family phage major tail protein